MNEWCMHEWKCLASLNAQLHNLQKETVERTRARVRTGTLMKPRMDHSNPCNLACILFSDRLQPVNSLACTAHPASHPFCPELSWTWRHVALTICSVLLIPVGTDSTELHMVRLPTRHYWWAYQLLLQSLMLPSCRCPITTRNASRSLSAATWLSANSGVTQRLLV